MKSFETTMKSIFKSYEWNNPQLQETLKFKPFLALLWALMSMGIALLSLTTMGFEGASEILMDVFMVLAGIIFGFFIALYVIDTRILTKNKGEG